MKVITEDSYFVLNGERGSGLPKELETSPVGWLLNLESHPRDHVYNFTSPEISLE